MTRYSFIRGDVIRNENDGPSGMPAFMNPRNIGMDEQEQNGVKAPKAEAEKCSSSTLLLLSHSLIFFLEIYERIKPITEIITKSRRPLLSRSFRN